MNNQDILNQISKENIANANASDISYSFVSTSRFIFYLKGLAIITFLVAACYTLYTHSFHKPNVPVNESSLYTPQYK